MEGVGHTLHLTVVVVHVEVALNEGPERGVEVQCAGLVVVEKLLLNGKSGLPSDASSIVNDVLEVNGERAKEP
jgi:hypothetical protein